jgi:hypothetical protein
MTRFDPKNGLVHIVKGAWDRYHDGILYHFMCGGDLVTVRWDPPPQDQVPTCLRCLSAG